MSSIHIEAPERLLSRPVYHGLPIPFTTFVNRASVPDFKVTDSERWHTCIDEHRCALCGDVLLYWCWYIGSIVHVNKQLVFDLGMHQECAKYASLTCPYIVYGKGYAHHIKPTDGGHVLQEFAPRSDFGDKSPTLYLFRGRSRSAEKVWYESQMWMAKTGAVYDAEVIDVLPL